VRRGLTEGRSRIRETSVEAALTYFDSEQIASPAVLHVPTAVNPLLLQQVKLLEQCGSTELMHWNAQALGAIPPSRFAWGILDGNLQTLGFCGGILIENSLCKIELPSRSAARGVIAVTIALLAGRTARSARCVA
jgi:hypothetical protein